MLRLHRCRNEGITVQPIRESRAESENDERALIGRIAEHDARVAGFSVSVLHESSWTSSPVCYLEDLFVDPALRGGGVGRALIQDLIDLGRMRGWSQLYWLTRANNDTARRLYDRFVEADSFVRYRLTL